MSPVMTAVSIAVVSLGVAVGMVALCTRQKGAAFHALIIAIVSASIIVNVIDMQSDEAQYAAPAQPSKSQITRACASHDGVKAVHDQVVTCNTGKTFLYDN